MSNLKKILLSLIIMGTTVSWAKEFKIMTYNIYGARLTNGQKLGESIKPYAPDFVSLQEVDKFTKRSNFKDITSDIAKELGYDYYYFKKSRDYDGGEYGISFISKYPLEKIYTYELPSLGVEKRQILIAELAKKSFGKKMLIINTHLDFKPDIKPEEMKSLEMITQFFKKDDIKFLSGDLNFLPTTTYYNEITKNWRDTYIEYNPDGKRTLSDPRIDYIFGSQSKKWKVKNSYFINDATQDWTKLSDHLPYMTILDIK